MKKVYFGPTPIRGVFVYQVEILMSGHYVFHGFIFARNKKEADHKLLYLDIPDTRINGFPFAYKKGGHTGWQ